MSADLVANHHGEVLRLLSSHAGRHFKGLQIAGRHFRAVLPSRTMKALNRLDAAFAVLRHITKEGNVEFITEIMDALTLHPKAPEPVDVPMPSFVKKVVNEFDGFQEDKFDNTHEDFDKHINLPAVVRHVQAMVTEEVTQRCFAEAEKHYTNYEKIIEQLKQMLTVKMDAHDSKFQKLEEDLREVIDHGGSDSEARPHVQKNSF